MKTVPYRIDWEIDYGNYYSNNYGMISIKRLCHGCMATYGNSEFIWMLYSLHFLDIHLRYISGYTMKCLILLLLLATCSCYGDDTNGIANQMTVLRGLPEGTDPRLPAHFIIRSTFKVSC